MSAFAGKADITDGGAAAAWPVRLTGQRDLGQEIKERGVFKRQRQMGHKVEANQQAQHGEKSHGSKIGII
jgi:hypothetical protein